MMIIGTCSSKTGRGCLRYLILLMHSARVKESLPVFRLNQPMTIQLISNWTAINFLIYIPALSALDSWTLELLQPCQATTDEKYNG